MREILFRGKSDVTGKWHKGFLYRLGGEACFIREWPRISDHRVDSETVGQYTGLRDKNGKPIFEGDILEAHYDEEHPEDETITAVKWGKANEAYCWCMENSGGYLDILDDFALTYNAIVGNIYDNPELIEE